MRSVASVWLSASASAALNPPFVEKLRMLTRFYGCTNYEEVDVGEAHTSPVLRGIRGGTESVITNSAIPEHRQSHAGDQQAR
jgi:hypothetical protein